MCITEFQLKKWKGGKNRGEENPEDSDWTTISLSRRKGRNGPAAHLGHSSNRWQQRSEFCAFGAMENALLMESFSIAVWSQINSLHCFVLYLVCSSAAVELGAVKQDGMCIRLRNCPCCLRFPCRTASDYTALVWSCRDPTTPPAQSASWELRRCHLTATCPSPECSLSAQAPPDQQKLLPGWGFSGPAPQTSRMACLHH